MDKEKTLDRRHLRQINNKEKATEVMLELILKTGEMPEVEEIIERAGISRRSFFRYFPSQSERIQKVNKLMIANASAEFNRPLPDQNRSFKETLRLFVEAKTNADEYRLPLRKLAEKLTRTTPEINKYYEEMWLSWMQEIDELFSLHLEGYKNKDTLLRHIHFNTSWRVWDTLRNDFQMNIEDSQRFIMRQILAVLGESTSE
jgi:AcrR family transcriptional regulator